MYGAWTSNGDNKPWIIIELLSHEIKLDSYVVQSTTHISIMTTWTLEGSVDGVNWVELDIAPGFQNDVYYSGSLAPDDTFYKFFKITDNSSTYITMGELYLFGEVKEIT